MGLCSINVFMFFISFLSFFYLSMFNRHVLFCRMYLAVKSVQEVVRNVGSARPELASRTERRERSQFPATLPSSPFLYRSV